jgi:hypothetical protein
MSTMARAATLCVLWAASAGAADTYSVREAVPETGSNIARPAVYWPVPVSKTYAELSPEERRLVREQYVRLGDRDEPPYPREGMAPILNEVALVQLKERGTGLLHLAVRVDAQGVPQGVAVLKTPEPLVAKALSVTLMQARYKPALCDGTPCAGDFSFAYDLQLARTHNFLADWHPIFWVSPLPR